MTASDFFLDTFTTALEPGEIISRIIVPAEPGLTGTSYKKFVQPASGFAIVGVAARVRQDSGRFTVVKVGVTGFAGCSFRATNVEQALLGKAANEESIRNAASGAGEGIEPNTDLHASANYRKSIVRTYTVRALSTALARSA